MKIQNFASNLEICIIADLYDFFKGGIGGGGDLLESICMTKPCQFSVNYYLRSPHAPKANKVREHCKRI